MAIRFTTKSVIMDGIRFKAQYKLSNDEETISILMTSEAGTATILNLAKGEEGYLAARAAYEEKLAKRAGTVDLETVKGMKFDGGWFRIAYQADIDRCVVTFKRKPAPEIRELVKAYGFWWTPSHKCWSRKINSGSWFAGQELYRKLSA